jgi:DNA-binding NarL/FixJ family response regulator
MINIVLADDHTIVRDGLRVFLELQSDIKVVGEATNGREAVRQVKDLLPDIVIMDITMPELNGIDATQQIIDLHTKVKVIILSMQSSSEHIFRALKAGASGYLLKESAGKEVVEAVRTVTGGKRYLSPSISETLVQDYIQVRQSSEERSPLESLSEREREILQLVINGRSSAEIADQLFLSPKTVDTYRSRMMKKLGVADLAGLIKFAVMNGLSNP